MIKTLGLTHLALTVSDLERSFQFYHDVFGMLAVYREPNFLQAQTPGARDVLVLEAGTELNAFHAASHANSQAEVGLAARILRPSREEEDTALLDEQGLQLGLLPKSCAFRQGFTAAATAFLAALRKAPAASAPSTSDMGDAVLVRSWRQSNGYRHSGRRRSGTWARASSPQRAFFARYPIRKRKAPCGPDEWRSKVCADGL